MRLATDCAFFVVRAVKWENFAKAKKNSLKLRLLLSLFKDKCIINPLLITKLKSIECWKMESWSAPFVNIFVFGSEVFSIFNEKKLVFEKMPWYLGN